MDNENNKETVETVEKEKSVVTLDDLSADELKQIVRDTRSEAKTYRISLRELQKEKEQFETVKRKEEDEKLKAKGEYQKLLDEREKEIETMKPKADAFEQLRLAELEEAKDTLKDKWDDEYSNLSIPALRKLIKNFAGKTVKVDSVDDGKSGDPPKVILSAKDRAEAYQKFPYVDKDKAEQYWSEIQAQRKKKE